MFGHGGPCGQRGRGGPKWARSGHRHGGGGFGIRRPLRFLAHKLELDEDQVQDLASILEVVKTERAQAAVDGRRAHALFADAINGETFDADKAKEAAKLRVEATQRVNDAVVNSLQQMHGLLEDDQRKTLALLLRTGPLSV